MRSLFRGRFLFPRLSNRIVFDMTSFSLPDFPTLFAFLLRTLWIESLQSREHNQFGIYNWLFHVDFFVPVFFSLSQFIYRNALNLCDTQKVVRTEIPSHKNCTKQYTTKKNSPDKKRAGDKFSNNFNCDRFLGAFATTNKIELRRKCTVRLSKGMKTRHTTRSNTQTNTCVCVCVSPPPFRFQKVFPWECR